MPWITPGEAAKMLKISRQALCNKLEDFMAEGQAKKEGSRWLVRTEGLDAAYDALTRSKADSPRRVVQDELEVAEIAKSLLLPADEEKEALRDRIHDLPYDSSMPRSEAERQIKVFQRRLIELDLAEREGQLVDVRKVKLAVFEQGRRVRDLLMGIPVRSAADLAAESDPAAVAILLERVLVEALEGLHGAP